MRRSSDRGQFEPLVALVAVLAVSAGLVTYADTLYRVLPGDIERTTAETAIDRVHDGLRVGGVAVPDRMDRIAGATPEGWRMNVTIQTKERNWHRGPDPPDGGLRASKRVSVRVGPSNLRPGTLRVVLWS